jgi:hypothetical protein
VNYQLRILDKSQKLLCNTLEQGFVLQELQRDAMDFLSAWVNFPLRIQVDVEMIIGRPAINHFHRGDFNDAVTLSRIKASRFSI